MLSQPKQRWLLGVGFSEAFFEGILISTASLFLVGRLTSDFEFFGFSIGMAVGVLLALRFSANILFGPIIGAISDRVGQDKTLALLSLSILVGLGGLLFLGPGWIGISLGVVFISSSGLFVTANAAASRDSELSERRHLFVGLFSTAIDVGAAAGPLFAYSSIAILQSLEWVYMSAAVLMFFVIQRYVRLSGQ
jgi:MFS family permease